VILAKNSLITVDDLPQENLSLGYSIGSKKSIKEVEKEHILNVLRKTGDNYSEAARILGISRMTLYNKAKEYGFDSKKTEVK
jgi:transcriptional regulator of acetoin/glycerol metabolism